MFTPKQGLEEHVDTNCGGDAAESERVSKQWPPFTRH